MEINLTGVNCNSRMVVKLHVCDWTVCSMRKKLFPKVDAVSLLADNGRDVEQTGHEVAAEESASGDDVGDDGKKKKKKEKVGFRDRKVNS